jgi:branched-subunit amino acid transport protein
VTGVWATIAALTVVNIGIKAAGPVALGGRRLPRRALAVIRLVAPALLAALVVYETLAGPSRGIHADARVIGLAAAAVALAVRLPLIAVLVAAMAATAAARALGLP